MEKTEELVKRLSKLKEIIESREKRLNYLNELKRNLYSLKWTKETYTKVIEEIDDSLKMINNEKKYLGRSVR